MARREAVWALLVATAGATLAIPVNGWAQGVDARTGVTIFEVGKIVSNATIFSSRSGAGQETDELRNVTSFSYSPFHDMVIGGTMPVVYKRRERAGRVEEAVGPGDLILLGKYRFFKHDAFRGSVQFSTFGGVELPTGFTDQKDGGNRLPPALQPGLGAVNGIFGLANTTILGRSALNGSVFYKLNTEGAQDFEAGDLFVLDVSVSHRVYQAPFPGPELGIGLGLTAEFAGRSELNGVDQRNSGGTVLFATPFLFYRPIPQVDVSLAGQVPVAQDLNGEQPEFDFRVIFGVSYQFF
ncbi:MAG: hypothetical protein ACE5I9_09035 [Candidatus Methylomirabilales bacterium]